MLVPEIESIVPKFLIGLLTPLGFAASIGVFIWKAGQWSRDRETDKKSTDKAITDHKEAVKKDIDGLGIRVGKVEHEHDEFRGRQQEMSEQISRTLGAHESLIKIIGEARGSSVQCREDTQALGEKIERKFDIAAKISVDNHLDLSTRLARVERELELIREDK